MGLISPSQLEQVANTSYLGLVDKKLLMEEYRVSEKTIDRVLNKLGLIHKKSSLIEMFRLYQGGLSSIEIGSLCNCSPENVTSFIRRTSQLGERMTGESLQLANLYLAERVKNLESRRNYKTGNSSVYGKYSLNEEYFRTVDTQDKAYFLGLLFADGCVHLNNLNLTSKDIDVLEKFVLYLGSNHPIKTVQSKYSTKCNITTCYKVDISNKTFIEYVRACGLQERKSKSCTFPKIDKRLFVHFVRGYYDGNGSFSTYANREKSSQSTYTKFCLSFDGTKEFLKELQTILSQECGLSSTGSYRKRFDTEGCCWTLRYSGRLAVKSILDWMYTDCSVYMERKFAKYQDALL